MKFHCLVIGVLLSLQLLLIGAQSLPKYCNHVIRAADSAGSQYELTKISRIGPRCPENGFRWKQPRFDHIIVFFKRNLSFQLCITLQSPGVAIYRLIGASRQPVATANASGYLGCFESECKHLTFLLHPEAAMRKFQFTYNYAQISKNQRCTAACRKACLCYSKFVFIATVEHTIYEDDTRLYRIYLNIRGLIKYNGTYVGRFYDLHQLACSNTLNVNNSTRSSAEPSPLLPVPHSGIVRVYSKSLISGEGKHLFAASLSVISGHRTLVLCCVEQDESYAVNVLRDRVFRRRCPCSAAN